MFLTPDRRTPRHWLFSMLVLVLALVSAPVAALAAPVDELATRLGLTSATVASAAPPVTTGNTRVWRNVTRVGPPRAAAPPRRGAPPVIAAPSPDPWSATEIRLESLGDDASGAPRFRLELAGVRQGDARYDRLVMDGRWFGTEGWTPESLLDSPPFAGTMRAEGVSMGAAASGPDTIRLITVELGGTSASDLYLASFTMEGMSLSPEFDVNVTLPPVPSPPGAVRAPAPQVTSPATSQSTGRIAIGRMALVGLDPATGRALLQALAASTDDEPAGPAAEATAADEEARKAAQRAAAAAFIDVMAKASFERAELSGIDMDIEGGKLRLGSFAIERFSPASIGRIALQGLDASYAPPAPDAAAQDGAGESEDQAPGIPFTFKIGQIWLEAVQTQALVVSARAFNGNEEARQTPLSRLYSGGPLDGGAEASGVEGLQVAVAGVEITLDRAVYTQSRNAAGVVTGGVMPPATLRIGFAGSSDLPQLAEMRGVIERIFGGPEIRLTMESAFAYDPQTDAIDVTTARLSIHDLMMVDVGARFSGLLAATGQITVADSFGGLGMESAGEASGADAVDIDTPARPDPSTRMVESFLQSMKVADARVTLQDQGLLERGFATFAESSGQPVAELRQSAAQSLERIGRPDAGGQALADLSRNAARFIRNGGTLAMRYRPAEPQMLASLSSPAALKPGDVTVTWRDPRAK